MSAFNFPSIIKESLDLSQYTDRQKIEIMEWTILNTMDNIADDLPIEHFIDEGVYIRSMMIPAGVVLTGKIHLEDHICMLLIGELSVMTDDGIKRVSAPFIFHARANIKKIGYAHSDCVFTTAHTTDLKDISKIEEKLFSNGDISWVDKIMNNRIGVIQ